MKRWIALVLAMAMLLSMTACGEKEKAKTPEAKPAQEAEETPEAGAESGAESGEKQYLKVQLTLNDTLSGLNSTYMGGYEVVSQWIFGNLMRYDTDLGEYVPSLAEKLDISDDGLVYTVTLRDNKFHDGTPITADDVIFTYTMAIRSGSGRISKLSALEGFEEAASGEADTVSGIQKVDDKTVSFTLSQPNSVFVEALANGTFSILPSAYFEGLEPLEINENAEFWKQPVGSGAYYVSETAYPNYIVLTRFDDYYDPSGIENVLCTYYADQEAANAALIAGELDWTLGLEEEAANNILGQNSNMEGITTETSYHRWFLANTSGTAGDRESHPSLKNARVRHAIDMLVDKEAACQLYGSLATPSNSHINSALPEYNSDLPVWKRDVEGAKKILEEENFRFDIPINIYTHYTDQITADFLDLVVQNLADGGIEATYTIDSNRQAYLESANYDLRYMATSSPIPTTFFELNSFGGLTTSTINSYPVDEPGFEEYQRSRYDDLIVAYKASLDPTEQKEILDQLQYNSYEDMYDIIVYHLGSINLYSKRWSGMPVFSEDYREIADFKFSNWKLLE